MWNGKTYAVTIAIDCVADAEGGEKVTKDGAPVIVGEYTTEWKADDLRKKLVEVAAIINDE